MVGIEGKRKDLINSTIELLMECEDVSDVTSRSIAKRANLNPAMINYYYGSKDALMREAMDSIFNGTVEKFNTSYAEGENPRKALFDFLMTIGEQVISFEKYTKSFIPDLILKREIEIPLLILPIIERCLKSKKTDKECRVIAYELVFFMQLVFYRSESFKAYSGIDVLERSQRRSLISSQLDLFLGESL